MTVISPVVEFSYNFSSVRLFIPTRNEYFAGLAPIIYPMEIRETSLNIYKVKR